MCSISFSSSFYVISRKFGLLFGQCKYTNQRALTILAIFPKLFDKDFQLITTRDKKLIWELKEIVSCDFLVLQMFEVDQAYVRKTFSC